jgi:ribosomal protein S18 acetylase RimI-like enzyme
MQLNLTTKTEISAQELDSLRKLLDAAFQINETVFPDFNQKLEEWMDLNAVVDELSRKGKLLLGYIGTELKAAAFINASASATYPDGCKYQLYFIAVNPEDHHQGYGTLLLRYAEQEAKAAGARSLWLDTPADWPELHKFYIKQGYVDAGVLKDYYSNGDAKFFKKKLI